jgi:ATP-dependent RNA helicase RhlE
VKLGQVSFLVLDEADRMFDMGFIKDVRRIVASVGRQRQTLLFSATMPPDVARLAAEILQNPERVEIAPQGRTVERIDQRVYFVNATNKRALLGHLLADEALERVIVFTRTKRGANRVAEALEDRGVPSEAIHGNKSQNARQRALENFSRGRARVLVATDLASRGIDVAGVTHVINYELPADAESYVHRIGRTARAGASGIAVSFCDGSERGQLKSIERLTNQRLTVVPTPANEDMPAAPPSPKREVREARDEQREGHDEHPRQKRGHRGPPRHRAFGDRAGGDRSGTPGEHQWTQGDYRDAPRSERQRSDRPQGERPQGDRPYNARPHGDRPHGDRPYGDRPQGDRPRQRDDRPRSHGGGHHGGHHDHNTNSSRREHPNGDRPHDDRSQGERSYGDRPQGPRPAWRGRRFGGRGRARAGSSEGAAR